LKYLQFGQKIIEILAICLKWQTQIIEILAIIIEILAICVKIEQIHFHYQQMYAESM